MALHEYSYADQRFARKIPGKRFLITLGATVLTALILFAFMCVSGQYWIVFGPIFLAIGVFFIVKVYKRSTLEYEYFFMTDRLDVVRNIGGEYRRRLTYCYCDNILELGPFTEQHRDLLEKNFRKITIVTETEDDVGKWYIVHEPLPHVKELIVIQPNEGILESLKANVQPTRIREE